MMTRSLAENYPYSKVYKAAIRGAKDEWIQVVEWLERGEMPAQPALLYLLSKMSRFRDRALALEDLTVQNATKFCGKRVAFADAARIIRSHIDTGHGARLFEVSIHSLFQVLEDEEKLEGSLAPMPQMRSANKKRDNIGDVEIVSSLSKHVISESWDTKYGKTYLSDELDELDEKLERHPETKLVGFITDGKATIDSHIRKKIVDISQKHDCELKIFQFDDFLAWRTKDCGVVDLGNKWLIAYAESLAQKRRDRAPIDEPTGEWLESLNRLLEKNHASAKKH